MAESQATHEAENPRYDVLVVSERAGYRAPNAAIRSMVHTLAFRGFANPVDEAIAQRWVEIYLEPGPAAHELFHEFVYHGPQPIFYDAVLRFEEEAFFADYGPTKVPLHWALEFRGCLFKEPLGPFRKVLLESLNLRAAVFHRPHQGPLPPHREVSEEEKPVEKKRRERGAGLVGTEVDEW